MKIETSEYPIPTWTSTEELHYLQSLAQHASHAIEVGTYMGASARAMLQSNPVLKLYCVDDFKVFGTQEITELFLREWIYDGRCLVIPFESPQAAKTLSHMIEKIDLIFIDDGHAEEDLKRDIAATLPLLRHGGTMLFHDWEGNNNVANGIKSMLPENELSFPVGRLARYVKP